MVIDDVKFGNRDRVGCLFASFAVSKKKGKNAMGQDQNRKRTAVDSGLGAFRVQEAIEIVSAVCGQIVRMAGAWRDFGGGG